MYVYIYIHMCIGILKGVHALPLGDCSYGKGCWRSSSVVAFSGYRVLEAASACNDMNFHDAKC